MFEIYALATLVFLAQPAPAEPVSTNVSPGHVIELQERVLTPDDGLLLGNGDLSISVYQTADRIIWRFGKGDVWDRRLDLSDDPKPAHIDEIAHGIAEEGWKCPPYGGPVEATRGTENPERMQQLCQGSPPSYKKRPYPCPKPVGELALQLPPDQMGLKIQQRLDIEQAMLDITCAWPSGLKLGLHCYVTPKPNVLVVQWKVEGWTPETRTGNGLPPVWFSLYRWADPPIQEFAARFYGDYRHDGFWACIDPKVTPLPPPAVRQEANTLFIEQTFPPDGLFPDGFRYAMTPFAEGLRVQHVDMGPTREARLQLIPPADAAEGAVVVSVATSSDVGGHLAESQRVVGLLNGRAAEQLAAWEQETRAAAAEFWSRSRVQIADPVLENLWYETLHARRCAFRADTVPPGLMMPSTAQDYSHWHGDYHTNYNVQEPYFGDYTANHFELGDAYFKAIEFFLPIGRTIARDYYNCRGVFIQLSGYPILAEDDPLGCVPMGRMAYMTGWAANQYWWRYLYSMDADWLRATGYPVIRDCALFYTDFMKKGADGLYHAFPSNQGEDGFTGDAKDYTDRVQVMRHARYCLRSAIQASEVLNVDPELRAEWKERLDNCAGDDGNPPLVLEGGAKAAYEANPPEFGFGRPYRPQPETIEGEAWPPARDGLFSWYFGPYGWAAMGRLRGREFIAERDTPVFHRLVERWRHPNGLVWGMAIGNYGHAGAWTEALGVIAPLQEMMLESWDGAVRVFPAWPKSVDAHFETLRAQGAFLVSASWKDGGVQDVEITSERGAPCCLQEPWPGKTKIVDKNGADVAAQSENGLLRFATSVGETYRAVEMP